MNRQQINLPTNLFYGLSIYSGDKQGVIDFVSRFLEEAPQEGQELATIFTPNPEQLVLARENPQFYQVLKTADILLPDGAGLVWAIDRKIQRVPGREIFHELLELAKEKQYKVFLLGGKPGAAVKIAALCQTLPTGRQVSNANCQVFVDDGPRENDAEILEKIREYRPQLLFVAYGAPYQEQWILSHRTVLMDAGVSVAMVVGGAFEYEAGLVPKVPQVVQDLHLEWLHRLIRQPWRWKRQLNGARFFLDVLLGKYT